jgi:ADP-heptose:LPS heptosyltransferase
MKFHPSRLKMRREYFLRAKALIRATVYGIFDGIVSMLPARTKSGGVLVVRLDAIGDFILWQRAASHLRSLYPGQRIVLVANALWASLAKQLPYWDEVISIEVPRLQKDPAYRLRSFYKVRRQGFAIALQPTYSRAYYFGDSVVRVSGAQHRIGSDGDLTNMSAAQKRIADRWYTQLIPAGAAGLTEIGHNDQFLRGIGWHDSKVRSYRLPQVATLTQQQRFDQPYFIVFPGASWEGRQWPEEAFARLIDETCKSRGWLPVLCGSEKDSAVCMNIEARTANVVVNLAGKTSLPEFCELVRRAQLLIGNETSAVHIAAAVGTPSICLLGGGHFGRFVPYPSNVTGPSPEPVYEPMPCFGCNWNCHLPHIEGRAVPCVAAITVAAVSAAIERVLAPPLISTMPRTTE